MSRQRELRLPTAPRIEQERKNNKDLFDSWELVFQQQEYIKQLETTIRQRDNELAVLNDKLRTIMNYETIWKSNKYM